MKTPLHVEVAQKQQSRASQNLVKRLVHSFLGNFSRLSPGKRLAQGELEGLALSEHVEAITFCDVEHTGGEVRLTDAELVFHVFKLDALGAETDTMADAASGEQFAAAEVRALPAQELDGLWESLVFDSRLKEDIVRFVETAFEFVERGVDPNVVGCNRVVLLHGPPGTGKTSLCRALAHKLSVRLGTRFTRARLVEINAHCLFSKWFSESGKLVARLFERVHGMAADRRLLVCVLVDEVESLAHTRRASLAGIEPSDATRAVNALLAQLDRLRRCPNALVLTTSNVTGAIDVAFADRADIKRRVGPPSARAAYEILLGCCDELKARGVVAQCDVGGDRLLPLQALEGSCWAPSPAADSSLQLWAVAQAAARARLSGRALRRLPFMARARLPGLAAPELHQLLASLDAALHQHLRDINDFHDDNADAKPNMSTE